MISTTNHKLRQSMCIRALRPAHKPTKSLILPLLATIRPMRGVSQVPLQVLPPSIFQSIDIAPAPLAHRKRPAGLPQSCSDLSAIGNHICAHSRADKLRQGTPINKQRENPTKEPPAETKAASKRTREGGRDTELLPARTSSGQPEKPPWPALFCACSL